MLQVAGCQLSFSLFWVVSDEDSGLDKLTPPSWGSHTRWLTDEGVERPGLRIQLERCWEASLSSEAVPALLWCPLKLLCRPTAFSAQFCFLPLPPAGVRPQEHFLKMLCMLSPVPVSQCSPSCNIHERMWVSHPMLAGWTGWEGHVLLLIDERTLVRDLKICVAFAGWNTANWASSHALSPAPPL